MSPRKEKQDDIEKSEEILKSGWPPFPAVTYRILPEITTWLFGCYGYMLGKFPYLFLVIGLATSFLSAAGLYQFRISGSPDDLVDQFFASGSRCEDDARVINTWTNMTRSGNQMKTLPIYAPDNKFNGSHPCAGGFETWRIEAIIISSNSDNLLTDQSIFDEILKVNDLARKTFRCDLGDDFCCDIWDLRRVQKEMFGGGESSGINVDEILLPFFRTMTYPAITYPAAIAKSNPNLPPPTVLTSLLGGVTTMDPSNRYNSKIKAVKAMSFQYMLPDNEESRKREAELTKNFKAKISSNTFKNLHIDWMTYMQLQEEILGIVFREVPKIGATFLFVLMWCFIGSLHTDALSSKPWCSLVGICCTFLACLAGFGAIFWSGGVLYPYVVPIPLMALAIGLDDMFILMGNWHRTSISMPREERAKFTLQQGGTSIFVTFIMTIIDFIIGSNTQYPAIQGYSTFAIWTLVFDFWLQMTVFTAVLVLTDSWERKRKHGVCCCIKVTRRTRKDIMKRSPFWVLLCTYGRPRASRRKDEQLIVQEKSTLVNSSQSTKSTKSEHALIREEEETAAERYIREKVAPKMLHPVSRLVIMLMTVGLLGASFAIIWTQIHVGFRSEDVANDKSNTHGFLLNYNRFFTGFSEQQVLQVLFNLTTSPFDRNFTKIQHQVLDMTNRITNNMRPFFWDDRFNDIPLRDHAGDIKPGTDLQVAVDMISQKMKDDRLKPRIVYDPVTGEERFVTMVTFHLNDMADMRRGSDLVSRLLAFQSLFEDGENVHIYIADVLRTFRNYAQIIELPYQFVYFSMITIASTVLTSVVMIPNPICMFWLALSSMGIILGTIAGMVLWDVNLDPLTIVYLLMAIGATADYVCHCIYTFTIIEDDDDKNAKPSSWPKIRYRKACRLTAMVLTETGPAVVGTFLAIVATATSGNNLMRSFFKLFFIAVLVGFTFMCVILPAVLCQFGPVASSMNCACCSKKPVTKNGTKKQHRKDNQQQPPPINKIADPQLFRSREKQEKFDKNFEKIERIEKLPFYFEKTKLGSAPELISIACVSGYPQLPNKFIKQ